MSRERLNNESLTSELSEFESALGRLRANGAVNRDELLFEAGRRSGSADSGGGVWKAISVALAIMFVAQSVAYWPQSSATVTDSQVTDGIEHEASILLGTASPERMHQNKGDVSAAQPMYLEIRRTALADGIDAAYTHTDAGLSNSSEPEFNQRRLLEDLLGS